MSYEPFVLGFNQDITSLTDLNLKSVVPHGGERVPRTHLGLELAAVGRDANDLDLDDRARLVILNGTQHVSRMYCQYNFVNKRQSIIFKTLANIF